MIHAALESFRAQNPLVQALILAPLLSSYWLAPRLATALLRSRSAVAEGALPKARFGVRSLPRWLLPAHGAAAVRQLVMLAASLAFLYYMTGSPAQIAGLLALGTVTFALGRLIARASGARRRLWLLVALGLTLGWLIGFKYLDLIADGLNALLGWRDGAFALPKLFVPLGISYYVFRIISYLVETYWEEAPRVSLLEYLHYLSFFPTVIAGPIERIGPFHEADRQARFSREDLSEGLHRIVIGLGKKVLLADLCGGLLLGWPLAHPDAPGWLVPIVFYAFWWRLYWDFAGYSDLAIGAGRLFGYRLIENFDRPYLAANLQDFWQRWHRSLSFWIRDYLYYPVLTMRQGRRLGRFWTYTALLVSMTLCGLWHGASVQFLFWGVYHGLGLAGLAAYQEFRKQRLSSWTWLNSRWMMPAGVFLTFNFVTLGHWLFLETGWEIPRAWLWKALIGGH